ncbi:GAF domain-containing protein [Arthrobacter sp. CAN_A6]|uniref:GAF domain-containing protein n=1 Tax=Arthrobacter sp. CAN_A6 TaxID=2787721 RepID=UPI0018C92C16
MDERTQQDRTRAALVEAALPTEELWVSYFGLGGSLSEFEIDAYLNAMLALPALERDLLAAAANELLEDTSLAVRVPPSEDGAPQYLPEEARRLLGAAGAFLLTSAEAEEERLEALTRTQLLDSPNEERFDRITRQAKEHFHVSTAIVSLIDDHRQFLKSLIGPLTQNVPREISFCNATIRNAGLLVVNDALTDARFATNPLVTGEPFIRFYAGYPLRGPGGWTIGTLCVIDQEPRTFTVEDERALRELATAAQHEIDS